MPPVSTIPGTHAVYGINVFLQVDGKKYPIVSTVIEYTLNQIPVAAVTVPAGVKISKDNEPDINTLPKTRRIPAKILVSGVGKPHPNGVNALPTSNITDEVLFDGYITATHNHISVGSVSTTVILFGWLQDLDVSTLASGEFVKATPSDWFSYSLGDYVSSNSEFPYPLGPAIGGSGKGLPKLRETHVWERDWWEGIFKPGIEFKISQSLNSFLRLSGVRPINSYVASAINRIFSNGRLTLNSVAAAGIKERTETASSIAKIFTDVIMQAGGGSSAFEKLVSLGREFKFVLAPSIQYAKLMEYNPVAPATHFLKESEFDFGPSTPNPTVVPAAVILHGNNVKTRWITQTTPAGTVNQSNPVNVDTSFVGQYPNPIVGTGIATGPFLVVPTPRWMYSFGGDTSTFNAGKGISISPDTQYRQGNTNPVTPSASAITGFRKFADAYAASTYFDALFSAKTQDVVCGFRTDIEPGSCLHLAFNKNVSGKKFEKRGIVNSVVYSLSGGNSPRVTTTYKLRHVLDSDEASYFGIDIINGIPHPLFVGL
jgi:hypothetical protein